MLGQHMILLFFRQYQVNILNSCSLYLYILLNTKFQLSLFFRTQFWFNIWFRFNIFLLSITWNHLWIFRKALFFIGIFRYFLFLVFELTRRSSFLIRNIFCSWSSIVPKFLFFLVGWISAHKKFLFFFIFFLFLSSFYQIWLFLFCW